MTDGIRVYTKTTCGGCGEVHEESGSRPNVPPVGWSSFTLSRRRAGDGWSGGVDTTDMVLCNLCHGAVLNFLKGLKDNL